ncbi:DUF6443 domain-containing protein [Pedobacter chitinilyticus]|uniref:RHS repeat-associated core domain-containing protein n=1 Tax=Pedobacter chitinilyticus TaxID=2233776 RepID=A0A443Z094_9SPHI|nr:DUF6443 domain-containing protein [Pedobacter chitinilyticus]RWU09956.1 RHS repeat-associated core domain-containing protein [Pedobacter chitinilyticus]
MKKRLSIIVIALLVSTFGYAQQHQTYLAYHNQPELSASGSVTLLPNFHAPAGSKLRVFIQDDCGPLASVPSSNQNYILTRIFKVAGVNAQNLNDARTLCQENQTIQYFDGLGRPLQTVLVGGSPGYQDIVTPMAYDALGREAVKYQPYAAGGTSGSYRAAGITDQLAFYMGQSVTSSIKQTGTPFSITKFEPSPLNRVERQGFSGDAWQPGSVATEHTARLSYGTNNSDTNYGTTGFAVRLFRADAVTTAGHEHERTLSSNGFYGAGQLYLTTSKDENWQGSDGKKGTVEEYKDKEGRVVLKRMFNEKGGNIEVLSTYYVYDDLGNLSFVLPPGASPDAGVPNGTLQEQFCYQYRYDGKRRLTEKRLPGKGWEHLVYNQLDQVVLTQDVLQRNAGQWLFTKYDALGRIAITGVYSNTAGIAAMQSAVDGHAVLWEERDNTNSNTVGTGYSNLAFPANNITYYHSINYYDDYDFYNNAFGQPNGTTQVSSARTKGLPTGARITTLGTGNMLLSVSYYDSYGRVIQIKSEHHLNNGTDVLDTEYNFDGSVKNTTRTHLNNGNTTVVANSYQYDHMGRKTKTYQSTYGSPQTSGTEVLLSELQYNHLGQLENKKLHNGLQTSAFTYNERGWLKTSNSAPLFNMTLQYNDGAHQQFNGNISGQSFTNNSTNAFTYQYDKLNRLINGTASGMSEVLDYDVMGNILSLDRDGTGAKIYNYTGNRLQSVSGLTGTYVYDDNGNATTDARNGVGLSYNHLSLPISANKTGLSLTYTYDAAGRKLKKVSTTGTTTTTDYVDGIQYTNNVIDFIQTEEGIARNSNGSYTYEYNLTDHLGNVRVTFKENGGTALPLERTDYYAFGKRSFVGANLNRYLYNGKELQEELGQYDYGARFYDPEIGRWNVIDPLSAKYSSYSPYIYTINNPIKFIDPNGMEIGIAGDKEAQDAYLKMLYNSTGNKYEIKDGKLSFVGEDKDFKGTKSSTLANVISKGIGSKELYSLSLVGSKGDDSNVFVDSYQQGKIDISDLTKMGEASLSLQGAAIGHFLNEIQEVSGYGSASADVRDASFNSAHNPSLNVEGKIYGELSGDASITTRSTIPSAPSNGFQSVVFHYNANHQYVLQQGATSTSVKTMMDFNGVKIPSTTTTIVPTGILKSVTKKP